MLPGGVCGDNAHRELVERPPQRGMSTRLAGKGPGSLSQGLHGVAPKPYHVGGKGEAMERGQNLVRAPMKEEIEAAKSPAGGWSRAQLAEWGVPWPPPKGWRRNLENRSELAPHPTPL